MLFAWDYQWFKIGENSVFGIFWKDADMEKVVGTVGKSVEPNEELVIAPPSILKIVTLWQYTKLSELLAS